MPETTVVVFDNSMSSQNEDYFPSRYVLQKEIIDEIVTSILESSGENLVGLVPLGQDRNSDILTPTKVRSYLSTFLHQTDLKSNVNHSLCLFQADQSLHVSDFSSKTLIMFVCSPVERFDEVFASLYNIVAKGIIVKVISFGDAKEFGRFLKKELKYENFDCLIIEEEEPDFIGVVTSSLQNSYKVSDPDLEEAIRRSLQQ